MLRKRLRLLKDQKGIVLVLSLLVLLTISVLAAGLMLTAITETKITANGLWDVQALFIAEAGIEEVIQRLYLAYPTAMTVNGRTFNAAIRDTGFLDSDWATKIFLCVYPPPDGSGNIEHTATIQPEDSWLKYSHPTDGDLALTIQHKLNGDGTIAMWEGQPIHLISVSGRKGFVKREVLAEVYPHNSWQPESALLCEEDIVIGGNPEITGDVGHVHTNSDISIVGDPHISGDVTASGTINITGNPTIDGNIEDGVPKRWIPDVKACDYRYMAEFILCRDGIIRDRDGDPVSDDLGWRFAGGRWRVQDEQPTSAVYYVEGNAVISSSPGEPDSPWETTIIAEGSISFTGNPYMHARYQELLLVAEGDADRDGSIDEEPVMKISGNPAQETANYDGTILSAGDIQFIGNPGTEGCLIAEGGIDAGGNSEIIFSGTDFLWPYLIRYHLLAWRER